MVSHLTRVSEEEREYLAFLHRHDASLEANWSKGSRRVAIVTMLSGIGVGLFLWRQYAETLASLAEGYGVSQGAVLGAYGLAWGAGSCCSSRVAWAIGWRVRGRLPSVARALPGCRSEGRGVACVGARRMFQPAPYQDHEAGAPASR